MHPGLVVEVQRGTIARERAIGEILELIDAGARWITIWGPAGVGKSALAHAALQQAAARGHRSSVIDCTDMASHDALCARVALELEIAPGTIPCAARVAASLAAMGPRLLVLDGWERPDSPGTELVHRWLDVAPELIIITTARHRAGSPREVVVEVDPLGEEDGVRLFHGCFRALRRDGTDVPDAIARDLVRSVDGLPFAIELVAAVSARVGLARMREDVLLDVPGLRLRGGHVERCTLRHALDISWASLSEGTAALLSALSVFAGEFGIDDASYVAGRDRIVPELVELCESALLRARAQERFSMLVTVRASARERLAHDPTLERGARERHADLFVRRACAAPVRPREADDVVDALRWLASRAAIPLPVQAVLNLEEELQRTGHLQVLDELFSSALGGTQEARPGATLACAWRARGRVRRMQGRLKEARADLEHAASLAASLEAPRTAARANLELALVHSGAGELEAAEPWFTRAMEQALRFEDRACELEILTHLATLESLRGRWERARELRSRALVLARETGDRAQLGTALGAMAIELLAQGDLEGFERIAGEARELLAAVGDVRALAALDLDLGVALAHRGQAELAVERLESARNTMRAIGLVANEASAELNLGTLEQERFSDPARGLERFEIAAQLCRDSGATSVEAVARARLAVALACRGASERARAERDAARSLGERAEGYLARVITLLVLAADVALAQAADVDTAAREALGADPHDGLFEGAARRLLRLVLETQRAAAAQGPMEALPERTLLVSSDGCGFRPSHGDWRDLRRRRALQRVLAALVDGALQSPGTAIPVAALVDRGWPGERILRQAAAARVHVAISTLRKLGLEPCILRNRVGYLLRTDWEIRIVDSPYAKTPHDIPKTIRF